MTKRDRQQDTLDLVAALEASETPDQVHGLFQKFIEDLGFSGTVILKVPEMGEALEDCILMNTYPQDWSIRYNESGYLSHDPIVRELFSTTQPFS